MERKRLSLLPAGCSRRGRSERVNDDQKSAACPGLQAGGSEREAWLDGPTDDWQEPVREADSGFLSAACRICSTQASRQ